MTLDDNPGISQTFPIQVTNLSNNFVTFREDFPLGSIKEVHEVIEVDDDDEGDENTHPSPAQSSDPMASAGTAYNIRNCSPSANAEEPSPKSIPSPENAQEDISYPEFPTNMKDAQEWLLDVQPRMPEHIKDMLLRSCVHLTDVESAKFGEVFIMYADLFAKNDNYLGCFTEMEHSIDTGDTPPIKQQMRRTPLHFRDEEEAYLKKMLDSKVIQPSNSEWASPLSSSRRKMALFAGQIKEYAKLACPLYELTGPKAPFHWDVPQQEAFEALKNVLVSAPVLAYPNSTDMFILDMDASDTAIGAELLQLQEGEGRVISYGSFSLTPAQRNYCTTRKELLALI